MNLILKFFLGIHVLADMSKSKMAVNFSGLNDTPESFSTSSANNHAVWFCYGFATAAALFSLYFLIMAQKKSNLIINRRALYTALVLFILAIFLWTVPSYLFLSPRFSGNFDMRTT